MLFPSQIVYLTLSHVLQHQVDIPYIGLLGTSWLHDKPGKTTSTPKHKADVRTGRRDPCKGQGRVCVIGGSS